MPSQGVKIDGSGSYVSQAEIGSILFVGARGLLSEDNANFKWDEVSESLVVKKLTPLDKILAADGSAAAPSYAFVSTPGIGFWRPDAATLAIQLGGVNSVVRFVNSSPDSRLAIDQVAFDNTNQDVVLRRDAANTLAQRNGVNAQAFRIYNTFTDTANYERLFLSWAANIVTIGTEGAGTGLARTLNIFAGPNGAELRLGTGSSAQWMISNSGHFFGVTDNTYDIGNSGANRPRSIFVGTSIQIEVNNGLKLTNQTNGAAAGAGTLANAPAAGNPTFWMPITVNGVNKHIPCW